MANSPKILYVDDEEDLLDLAASFFEDENLPVQTCSDFNKAVEILSATQFDLIISDAKMPVGSGYELFHVSRQKGHAGKFILVTGNVEKKEMDAYAKESQFDMIIYKPVKFEELIATVKNLLKI